MARKTFIDPNLEKQAAPKAFLRWADTNNTAVEPELSRARLEQSIRSQRFQSFLWRLIESEPKHREQNKAMAALAEGIDRGERPERAWHTLVANARTSGYLTPGPPGSSLSTAPPERHQLALVTCNIVEMDWLHLDRQGHRRARLRDGEPHWLVPQRRCPGH